MKKTAILRKKYTAQKGTNETSRTEWESQRMKFEIVDPEQPGTIDSVLATCYDSDILDDPSLSEGSKGVITLYLFVEEVEGVQYQRTILKRWEPMTK